MVTGAFLRAFLAVAAVAVVVPAVALALRASTPVGNPVAGKPLFVSTCGVCHRLREAKTVGVIGPNLDKVPLPEATIVKAITLGGASVMTKAQVAKYSTQMIGLPERPLEEADRRHRRVRLQGDAPGERRLELTSPSRTVSRGAMSCTRLRNGSVTWTRPTGQFEGKTPANPDGRSAMSCTRFGDGTVTRV